MSVAIKVVCWADGDPHPQADQWVSSLVTDVDDFEPQLRTTPDQAQAKRYASITEALAAWQAVSTRRPVRPDGRPNRPGTALTVEMVRCDA